MANFRRKHSRTQTRTTIYDYPEPIRDLRLKAEGKSVKKRSVAKPFGIRITFGPNWISHRWYKTLRNRETAFRTLKKNEWGFTSVPRKVEQVTRG